MVDFLTAECWQVFLPRMARTDLSRKLCMHLSNTTA